MEGAVQRFLKKMHGLIAGEEGQDLVEYALLCTLISLSLVASTSGIASSVNSIFVKAGNSLAPASSSGGSGGQQSGGNNGGGGGGDRGHHGRGGHGGDGGDGGHHGGDGGDGGDHGFGGGHGFGRH